MKKSNNLTSDCFNNQKFLLRVFGLVPNENVFYKVYSICLLFILTIYPLAVIPQFLKEYYDNFNKFLFSALIEFGYGSAVTSIYLAFWNRFELKKLFEKIELLDELSNFSNANGEIVIVKQYKNIVRKQSYLGYSAFLVLWFSSVLLSVVLSLNKEEWLLPFGSGPHMINNNIEFIIQMLHFGITALIIYLLLLIYVNVLTIICGHCKLLQHYLAISLNVDKEEILEEDDTELIENKTIDWELFKVQLQGIVPYHVGVFDVADQVETIFSFIIFNIFGAISLGMCFIIYHAEVNIEMEDFIKDVVMIVTGFSMLIIICTYGENVVTESDKIASVCYELDFTDCDIRIQKCLLLIMARAQRPITLTIGKFRVLNLQTMLDIFQSIYSYYTILRNMKME